MGRPPPGEALERKERQEFEMQKQRVREEAWQEKLANAYKAVAATDEGKLVLSQLVSSKYIEDPFKKFSGNSHDAFGMGRAWFAAYSKSYLREVLDRETFLEIIEPKREDNP